MTRSIYLAGLVIGIGVAGCGGGSNAMQVPQTALDGQRVSAETESSAMAPSAQPVAPSTSDLLYVGNTGNNSISIYRHDAQGNAAPLRVIKGAKTGISRPGQLAEDAAGDLYVANGSYATQPASSDPAILVFAPGSNGNVAPIRKLAGPLTGIGNIAAMTVDRTTGKIFVVDYEAGTNGRLIDVSLLRFAPNAHGNVAPLARSLPGLSPVIQLASDSTGRNLIAARYPLSETAAGFGIDTLAKQFYNGTPTTVQNGINAQLAGGIAADPTTHTYLVTSTNGRSCSGFGSQCGIYRLAETATGNGPFYQYPQSLTPAPMSIITSDQCGAQLALGYLRNIYVTHNTGLGCATDAVYVYAHDAAGNVPALRVLQGPATGLNLPYGIYEGQ